MFQITTDLSSLSRAQREAVASFVLTFPQLDDDDDLASVEGLSDQPSPEEVFAATGTGDNDRLDKTGIPWDERIHASSRVKTSDGCWRKRRGIDDATVATVEAELKALMAIPQLPITTQGIAIVPQPPVAVTQEIAAVASVPAPPAVADRVAFVALITLASNAIGAKKLTQEQLTGAVVAAGVPSLPLLGNRLDLVPQVQATVEALIAAAA